MSVNIAVALVWTKQWYKQKHNWTKSEPISEISKDDRSYEWKHKCTTIESSADWERLRTMLETRAIFHTEQAPLSDKYKWAQLSHEYVWALLSDEYVWAQLSSDDYMWAQLWNELPVRVYVSH